MQTIQMPLSEASSVGLAALVDIASEHRVVLTVDDEPVTVIDSFERVELTEQRIQRATDAVLAWVASRVAEHGTPMSLDELCATAGVDPEVVQERAHQRFS